MCVCVCARAFLCVRNTNPNATLLLCVTTVATFGLLAQKKTTEKKILCHQCTYSFYNSTLSCVECQQFPFLVNNITTIFALSQTVMALHLMIYTFNLLLYYFQFSLWQYNDMVRFKGRVRSKISGYLHWFLILNEICCLKNKFRFNKLFFSKNFDRHEIFCEFGSFNSRCFKKNGTMYFKNMRKHEQILRKSLTVEGDLTKN